MIITPKGISSGISISSETPPGANCRNCGQCCDDLIPISDEDIKRVRDYVQRNGIHPYYGKCDTATIKFSYDGTLTRNAQCPLRHPTKGCTVYQVRPLICRTYLCTDENALVIRDQMHTSGKYINRSMDDAIFGEN